MLQTIPKAEVRAVLMDPENVVPVFRVEERPGSGMLYAFAGTERPDPVGLRKCWAQALNEVRRRGKARLVFEQSFGKSLSASEASDLASWVATAAPEGLRIALVDRNPEHSALNSFAALVATNEGLDFESFMSRRDAERWLESL